jgi:hypothetical protein
MDMDDIDSDDDLRGVVQDAPKSIEKSPYNESSSQASIEEVIMLFVAGAAGAAW